eukprot:4974079-Amphidinium_carterae.2
MTSPIPPPSCKPVGPSSGICKPTADKASCPLVVVQPAMSFDAVDLHEHGMVECPKVLEEQLGEGEAF